MPVPGSSSLLSISAIFISIPRLSAPLFISIMFMFMPSLLTFPSKFAMSMVVLGLSAFLFISTIYACIWVVSLFVVCACA